MNNDNSEQVGEFFELLLDQINIVISVLSRPVVQQQILEFLGILLASWFVFKGVRGLWKRHHPINNQLQVESLMKGNHWLAALYHLLTPILALIFLYITIAWFASQGHPNSLLQELTKLIWLWVFYRILITLLYTRFGESLHPYRNPQLDFNPNIPFPGCLSNTLNLAWFHCAGRCHDFL